MVSNLELPWWVAALCLLVGLALGWWRARGRVGRRNATRLRRAQRAESDAERLLEREGFVVEDRQVTVRWELEVDGEPREVWCRADLVVRARRHRRFPRGARFVADVKTGERAPDPTHPATRRQLMEYQRVFDCDGVLVVDMDREVVHHVRFPAP